jgi:enterochelin esterase family protein
MNKISCFLMSFVILLITSSTTFSDEVSTARQQYSTEQLFSLWKASKVDTNKLYSFYSGLDQKHTIESIKGDEENVLVTYFALGGEDTDYILQAGGPDFYGLRFNRIGDSKLYFCTQRIPKDAMFIYGYNEFKRIEKDGVYITEVDHVHDGAVIGPEAPLSRHTQLNPDAQQGTLESIVLTSQAFESERRISVYTPANYDVSITHNVVIFFDARAYTAKANQSSAWESWVPTATILDNLIAEELIGPTIAVFIWNHYNRDEELTKNEMAQFVGHEVVDWLKKNKTISSDPQNFILSGSSRGGYAAADIALQHADKFGNVLSQSGAFWITNDTKENWPIYPRYEGKLTRVYKESENKEINFYLSSGLFDLGAAIVGTNRQMSDILELKGYKVKHTEFNGSHSFLNWRHDLPNGLIHLLGE